jgi:hypothetical protein
MQFMIVVTFLADGRVQIGWPFLSTPTPLPRTHAPTHPQTQLKVGAAGKATRMAPWSVCDARDSIGQAPQRHGNHGLGWRGTGNEFAVVSKAPSTQAHDQQTEASERLRMSP